MERTNRQPVFRIQFTASARNLRNDRDREGVELPDSRCQVFKDFYNPVLPEVGQRTRFLGEDEVEITDIHFDPNRDLWIIDGSDVAVKAVGEKEARQALESRIRQLAGAGWMVTKQTGSTRIIELSSSPESTDYGDTELAGP